MRVIQSRFIISTNNSHVNQLNLFTLQVFCNNIEDDNDNSNL